MSEKPLVTAWMPEKDPAILRRVGKLGEELSELSKVCFRIVIQGATGVDPETGEPNLVALQKEMADVHAQILCTIDKFNLSKFDIGNRAAQKMQRMNEWEAMVKDLE